MKGGVEPSKKKTILKSQTYLRRFETRPWLLSVGPKLARGLQVSSQSLLLTV